MYHTTVLILLILLHKLTSHCTSFSSQDVIISFFCSSFTIMPFVDIETFFIFVWVFDMNVYVCVPGMCLESIEVRRGHQSPGTEVTYGWDLPCVRN